MASYPPQNRVNTFSEPSSEILTYLCPQFSPLRNADNGYFTVSTFDFIQVQYILKNSACCLCKFKNCQIIKRAEYEFTSLTIIPCHIIMFNREFITGEKKKIQPLDSYKELTVLTIIYFPREGWRAEFDSAEAVPHTVTSCDRHWPGLNLCRGKACSSGLQTSTNCARLAVPAPRRG